MISFIDLFSNLSFGNPSTSLQLAVMLSIDPKDSKISDSMMHVFFEYRYLLIDSLQTPLKDRTFSSFVVISLMNCLV